MSNRKFRDLPLYTGDTSSTYLILNNSSQTTTHKVTKETFLDGNNTFHGNQTITGSLSVSGSTLQTGNNTLIGNTVLSGSLSVSGSFTGSINIMGDVNVISGSGFYRWGNKLFNYGNFFNTSSQSGSANTVYPILLDTIDIAEGFTLVSGSRITAQYTGVYNIQFSSQLYANDNAETQFSFWLAYTGSNVSNTQSEVTIPKEAGGGSTIIALNLIKDIKAGDYVELMYSKTTILGSIKYLPASTGPNRPAAPSTILSVVQIA